MGLLKPLDNEFDSTFFNQFADESVISFKNQKWLVGDVVGNNLMLIYNKEFIDRPPQNTGELIEIGKKNTVDLDGDGKIDRYGLVWNYTEPYFYVPWIGGFGDWLIKNDRVDLIESFLKQNQDFESKSKAVQFLVDKNIFVHT